MELLVLALRFVNIVAAAIVAGGQVYVFRVVMPVKKRFDTRDSVQLHNAMLGHQTDHYMKPSGIVSGLCALALVGLGVSNAYPMPTVSIVLTAVGILGTLAIALLSRYGNVPTNAWMLTWSLDDIPDDYPTVRARWDLIHTFRVISGTTALTCYLLAALLAETSG